MNENDVQQLIVNNMKLVPFMLKKFKAGYSLRNTHEIDDNDLLSEGYIALMNAAKRFDASKGFKFTSYAGKYIKARMLDYVNSKTSTIKLPLYMMQLIYFIKKHNLEDVDPEIIAKKSDYHVQTIHRALSLIGNERQVSLETTIDDNGTTLCDLQGASDDTSESMVSEFFECLTDRQADVLRLKMEGYTQSEICELVGVTRQAVHNIMIAVQERYKKYLFENNGLTKELYLQLVEQGIRPSNIARAHYLKPGELGVLLEKWGLVE